MKLYLGERAYSRCAHELTALGYSPIALEPLPGLNAVVSDHADTLIFDCGELLSASELPGVDFKCAQIKPSGAYPDDVKLNALALGGCLFGRLASLSPELLELAEQKGLRKVNVRQGYARCSVLPLYTGSGSSDAAVSSDIGLSRAMRQNGIDVLEIKPGGIRLEGCEYGFIGGASIVDRYSHRVIFYGSLDSHPNGEEIRSFCSDYGYQAIELSGALTDFGGGVVVC